MERDQRGPEGSSCSALVLAFLTGAFLGAGAALLMAPESGPRMRKRLKQSARIAQEELADVAVEAREALGALGKDARQTIKQTASRLSAVLGATKDALKDEANALRGVPPHG